MEMINHYPVFEADQVLTSDDLNDMFNYLDDQERLTRTTLIGIGIVCGLELECHPADSAITITAGCGVTSLGYLISQETTVLKYYRQYTLPARVIYPSFMDGNQQIPLWELLSAAEYQQLDDDAKASLLSQPEGFVLEDKAVVLFLEMDPDDLKNCLSGDCDNKGINMELNIKRLLVDKKALTDVREGVTFDRVQAWGLPELYLQRFNVKATAMKDFNDLFKAYDQIINENGNANILDQLAKALQKQYVLLKPLLSAYPASPFLDVKTMLQKRYAIMKKDQPLAIQYFYDFLDDLVKAYHELKEKCLLLISVCCPDEHLFPLHLKLGEATHPTAWTQASFREYFIYSPLFQGSHELVEKLRVLFQRIVQLMVDFDVPSPTVANSKWGNIGRSGYMPLRITPSTLGRPFLSQRGIPYYYRPDGTPPLYQCWNYEKTRAGKANQNLSYFADQYNTEPEGNPIIHALEYSIEPHDFFRIEGHIGQNYTVMLQDINDQRAQYRLPFDVITLKLGNDTAGISPDGNGHFDDLESQFEVIKNGLLCRLGDQLCFYAGQPYIIRFVILPGILTFGLKTDVAAKESKAGVAPKKAVSSPAADPGFTVDQKRLLSAINTVSFVPYVVQSGAVWDQFDQLPSALRMGFLIGMYVKGQFLASRPCFEVMKTATDKLYVGQVYAASIKNGPIPAYPPDRIDFISDYYLTLIDLIEEVVSTIYYPELSYFDLDAFSTQLDALKNYAGQILGLLKGTADKDKAGLDPGLEAYLHGIVRCCDLERLAALKNEYKRRFKKLQQASLFSNFIVKHPGIDHKAGVPKGGTFILVYYEQSKEASAGQREETTGVWHRATEKETLAIKVAEGPPSGAVTTKQQLEELSALIRSPKYALAPGIADEILGLLDKKQPSAATADGVFQIKNKTVVADFYLPYRCGSDCGGTTYVFQEIAPVENPTISLQPESFCNNDAKTYPVQVNPAGGEVKGAGVTKDSLGQFLFSPSGLVEGDTKLTYELQGQRAEITVPVFEALGTVDFKYKMAPTIQNVTVSFLLSHNAGTAYHWDFGDNSSSDESEPSHSYTFEGTEKAFEVTLTVRRGSCLAVKTHRIICHLVTHR